MAMLQHMAAHMAVTAPMDIGYEEPEELEPNPSLPSIDLQNHAVPAQFRGYRPNRRGYRLHVMRMLYCGTWRHHWAFSTTLAWFATYLVAAVTTEYMRRQAYDGMWKVTG